MDGVLYWGCESPLHMMCIEADQTTRRKWDDVITFLQQEQPDNNAFDKEVRKQNCFEAEGDLHLTPLAIVSSEGPPNVVRAMLDSSPSSGSVSIPDRYGELPIHRAALQHRREEESIEVVRMLRRADGGTESLCAKDRYGRTPLHCAIDSYSTRRGMAPAGVVKELLGYDDDYEEVGGRALGALLPPRLIKDNKGRTPIEIAENVGATEDILSLLKMGKRRAQTDGQAVSEDAKDSVNAVTKNSNGEDEENDDDMPGIMYWGCESPFHKICIEADQSSRRPWEDVIRFVENEDCSELERQGRVSEGDLFVTPLAMVAQEGPPEVVRAVLNASPTAVNIPDRYGELPIHRAALQHRQGIGSVDVIRILLEASSTTLVSRDKYGRTPLHCALASHSTRRGIASLEVVSELIGDGRPLSMKDGRGKTPLQIARQAKSSTSVFDFETLETLLTKNSTGQPEC